MRLSSVDLPQPDGPMTATNSAAAIFMSTPRSARTGTPSDSYVLRRSFVLTTSAMLLPPLPERTGLCGRHEINNLDAIRDHFGCAAFHERRIHPHSTIRCVQGGVGRLTEDDLAARSGEILKSRRKVHRIPHQRVLHPVLGPKKRRGHFTRR